MHMDTQIHDIAQGGVKAAPMVVLASKRYLVLAGVILFGAVAHAIEDTKKNGWMGAGWFAANIFLAAFVGMVFAQVASIMSPEFTFAAGGVGGYMGPAAFKYVRASVLSRLGVTNTQQK